MRWPRATTRRLMALVLVSSIFLGGWVEAPRLRGRAQIYRERARMHGAHESRFQQLLTVEIKRQAYWSAMAIEWTKRASAAERGGRSGIRSGTDSWTDLARQATLLARCRQDRMTRLSGNIGHYANLRRKYEDAAIRPWLPVWPDPPPPE